MNLLLVTFSLRNQLRNYDQFFVSLRGNSIQWWHFIEQTCVVLTKYNKEELAERLYPYMEATDSLLIVKVTPNEYQGWLPNEAWSWLDRASRTATGTPSLPPVRLP